MTADKSTKYDRQLRLWGPEGQEKLENTHVLLVNASATGCEALKNLVLPGIGKFTIVDNQNITIAECSRNFFVSHSDLGSSRASSATRNLLELNPEVHGHFEMMDLNTALTEGISTKVETNTSTHRIVRFIFETVPDCHWITIVRS